MYATVASLLVILIAGMEGQETKSRPLARAHAHNDYHHQRPLIDALSYGFCSVEVDIFLVEGKLLVGHDRSELSERLTLQSLYLDPLRERVKQNNGRVYPEGPTITLLVDIKTNGEQVYAVLREVLASYKDILSSVEKGEYRQRAVQVIISGDRPRSKIAADETRYVGIDGRLSDLDSSQPAHLMPLISDRWTSHFRWRGIGEFPEDERDHLRRIVKKAHSAGRRVRFWATPERTALWKELLAAGVDHINTDQLDSLQKFLLEH